MGSGWNDGMYGMRHSCGTPIAGHRARFTHSKQAKAAFISALPGSPRAAQRARPTPTAAAQSLHGAASGNRQGIASMCSRGSWQESGVLCRCVTPAADSGSYF